MQFATGEAIARITLSRPEKRNALDPETIRQLRAAFTTAARDDAARVIVLAAAGPDFSAGADLESLASLLDASEEVHRADAQSFAELFLAVRALPKPVVAAVQGRALAGGAGLVAACDMAIAADDAELGFPEVKIGFVPAVVMALIRCAAGEKAAFDLVASGRTIAAGEAVRLGLLTRTAPADELAAEVERTAKELAALPADALARTKRLFHDISGLPLAEAFERGVEANVQARSTAAFRDGLARFLARRDK